MQGYAELGGFVIEMIILIGGIYHLLEEDIKELLHKWKK